jgi:hypothetical protein
MSETQDKSKELSAEELQEQSAEEVPDREAMSLVNANLAAPINAAVALNALSDGSSAVATGHQANDLPQQS